MKIGIIGGGNVSGTLGMLFAANGHDVVIGLRETSKLRDNAAKAVQDHGAKRVTLQEAVDFGEVIVLGVPGNAVPAMVKSLKHWEGKIVIDANNRFDVSESEQSLAQEIAELIPEARIVKAFNTIGTNRYNQPQIDGATVSMFICGDDEEAKEKVGGLVKELGFDLVDVGFLKSAGMVEGLARLWVHLARSGYGRDIGFKLLREESE